MRAQFLTGELFYTLQEAQILTERWRIHSTTVRPHSSLEGQPPAPEVWRREYNESRPHRALQDRTPEEFAKRVAENQLSEPLITAGHSP